MSTVNASSFTEFDRNAVVTIQGGGVYALSLLGQLQAVVQDHRMVPLALAGTSAGAIVATLYWARLPPQRIYEEIGRLCNPEVGPLTKLLGPFEPPRDPFNFDSLIQFKAEVEAFLNLLSDLTTGRFKGKKIAWYDHIRFPKFRTKVKVIKTAMRLKSKLDPHVLKRGIFAGQDLELEIDRIIRLAPDLQKYANELPVRPDMVCFRHIKRLMEEHPEECFRPPLFLATTNLSTRRLELFSSIDEESLTIPIARAVRASAGFPIFFEPVSIGTGPAGGWYVDGGVISNFPAWIFSHEFRRRMLASEFFRGLAMKTWVHVGLRVVDDRRASSQDLEQPISFARSLLGMFTGQTRNELEELLASEVPRSTIIRQPVSLAKGPSSVLDFGRMDSGRVAEMYTAARDFAATELAKLLFELPKGKMAQDLIDELYRLVATAKRLMGLPDVSRLRSNIFLPTRSQLVLHYSVYMKGDPDAEMVLSMTGGLAGACFNSRCTLICNLATIKGLAQAGTLSTEELFNMPPHLHDKVEPTRTWLASTPIFDPFDTSFTAKPQRGNTLANWPHSYRFRNVMDGAVLGVLNLDADWDYEKICLNPDPSIHYADPRVADIVDVMQATAFRLGQMLGTAFAGRSS